MNTAVFTIVTHSHLPLARVLLDSARRYLPTASLHVILADRPRGVVTPQDPGVIFIHADELGLPRFDDLAFVNDPTGLCCLLKPAVAARLLAVPGTERVLYLDADTRLFAAPHSLLAQLESQPIVLTPHALAPLPSDAVRTDADLVRSGAFNAGCFAVRREPRSEAFLAWWLRGMINERCLDKATSHDQPWLDLAPVYFPEIGICRDPGYNVAYWNLSERPLAIDLQGKFWAAGSPLVLFHFSFFSPNHLQHLAYRPPLAVSVQGEAVTRLVRSYSEALAAAHAGTAPIEYGYARFRDGRPITPAHRRYFLERMWDAPGRLGSPFDPAFCTATHRGLWSLHQMHNPVASLGRAVWRLARRLAVRHP